jgi:hypothetical protein
MKKTDFKTLCLIALVVTLAGCGIDWFPEFKRSATTPNPFSFTTKLGVPTLANISSNSVRITGFANSSTVSPISVSTGSAYSIDGAAAVSTAGTIKNNQSVKVIQQTSSSLPGAATVSTLTIGGVNGTFTTVTQTIVTPVFGVTSFLAPVNGSREISALISGTDNGGHIVTLSGANAQLAIANSNNVIVTPLSSSTLPLSVPFLNGQRILLLIPNPAPSATSATTLTIDSTNYSINDTSLVVTVSPI